jgi:molybdopterin converting factor small subunit
MKILVFGMLVEDIGSKELEIALQPDLDGLKKELISTYPTLKNRQFMIAVNKQKVNENVTLKASDEVALIPPFAGG